MRRIIFLLLLAAGLADCIHRFNPYSLARFQIYGIILAFVVGLIPSFHRAINQSVQWCNATLRPRSRSTAIAVGIVVATYLLLLAHRASETLFLKINDEHAYMIQARMLAAGRLWMSPYPPDVSPFFDALSLITDRVYAAMYFPGTAVAMVPFIWLHLPFWLMPLLASSLAAGLLYRVFAELFDPIRALIGVLMVASSAIFRACALTLLSQAPFLVAEMILLLAWFQFRRRKQLRWAFLLGAAAGYAAITRPLDAVCFVLPVVLAIAWEMRQQSKALLRAAAAILLAASPAILLLLIQNIGVSGHWNELAETYYNHENFPASPMGFHHLNSDEIPSNLNPVKQQWLHDWVIPMFKPHNPANALASWYNGRLRQTLENSLPSLLLIILLPLSLLSFGDIRRVVLGIALVLFLFGYAIYLFFLPHYLVAILPAMTCLVLMGWQSIERIWPSAHRANAFLLICLITLSIAIWPLVPLGILPAATAPDQLAANQLLSHLPKTPAVVLFRFDPPISSFHDDPVYNDGVARPDDARVIRARDRGPQENRNLIRYYADRQPNRIFYIYDPDARASGQNPLSPPLGTAMELNATETTP